jgi:hypothetical protein
VRFHTPGQFQGLFEQAGLEIMSMYGDWRGTSYHRGSKRSAMVGKRN